MQEMSDRRAVAGNLEDFVQGLRRKGVMLWMEGAGLRYRAPKGVLTTEERTVLSRANEEIAEILDLDSRFRPRNGALDRGEGTRRAPLTFTQLEYWRGRFRHGGRPIRHVASAFRLLGPLRIDFLEESVNAVSRRHEALRTRIVCGDGMSPIQEIADRYRADLEVVPLWSHPQARRSVEVDLQIRRAVLDSEDYSVSPLFKAVLLVIDREEHVLILALDHMISDLASLYLVSEEIFDAYRQLQNGGEIDLPRVSTQFPDLAARLSAQPLEALTRAWRRLEAIGRTRFPQDLMGRVSGEKPYFASVCSVISRDLQEELRAWARRHGTTVVIATLTVYVAVVLRWCAVKEAVIQFMTDGRTGPELERTIGYLAFAVYIGVAIEADSTFLDLLRVVTEEYCRARDEADFGYAFSQEVRPEFARSAAVNWFPAGGVRGGTLVPGTEIVLFRSSAELADMLLQRVVEFDHEPIVAFTERHGDTVCQVVYPRHRFSEQSMTRFAMNITECLVTMMDTPARRIVDIELK